MQRRGFFAPLTVMFLVIFAIMGVVITYTSSSDYSQSAITLYNLRARLVCQAVQEEAQSKVLELLNRTKKKELFDKVKAELKPGDPANKDATLKDGPTGNILDINLLEGDLLTESKNIATSSQVTIQTARIRFHSFRPLIYHPDRRHEKPESYYKDDMLDQSQDNPPTPGGPIDYDKFRSYDFQGYYSIEVECRTRQGGKTKQKVATLHDVKIVNVSPVAREFAFYQGMSLDLNAHGPYLQNDLNNREPASGNARPTAPFRIFGRGWGRILMRAQYALDTLGFPDGLGGNNPMDKEDPTKILSNSFMFPSSNQDGIEADTEPAKWYGWSPVPAPRGIMTPRTPEISFSNGFSFQGRGQARPHQLSGNRPPEEAPPQENGDPPSAWSSFWTAVRNVGRAIVDTAVRVGQMLTPFIGYDDMGNLLQENLEIFAESTAPGTGSEPKLPNRDFSLIGNPRGLAGTPVAGADDFRFSNFRGRLFSIDQAGAKANLTIPNPSLNSPNLGLDGSFPNAPPLARNNGVSDLFPTWHYAPEAFILSRISMHHFTPAAFTRGYTMTKLTDKPDPKMPFALNWENKRIPTLTSTLGTYATALTLIVAAPFAAVAYPLALAVPLGAAAAGDVSSWFFQDTSRGSIPGADNFFLPDDPNRPVSNTLPTNQKPWMMAAVRRYKRLDNITSMTVNGQGANRILNLDGVIILDRLYLSVGFKYRGRGAIVSPPMPAGETRPEGPRFIPGGILAATDRVHGDNPDYLSIIALGDEDAQAAKEGRDNLLLIGDQPTDGRPVNYLDASIYSTHGVHLRPGTLSTIIDGNVYVGLVNKHKMPDEASTNADNFLHIRYNSQVLGPLDDAERTAGKVRKDNDGKWHQATGSPRIAGYYDDYDEGP